MNEYGAPMESLKQRLRQQREDVMGSLKGEQRKALEDASGLGWQETWEALGKLTDGLWVAVFEIAKEIDRLKADSGSNASD